MNESKSTAQDFAEHAKVFNEAHRIFIDRSKHYGQLHRQYGALSNLLQAARKIDRLMEYWWHAEETPAIHKDALDDAFDGLNYLAFFIRNARDGNLTGAAPKRPTDYEEQAEAMDGTVIPLHGFIHYEAGDEGSI